MSHLTYYDYPGVGVRNRKELHYSQACRIGDRIECSGQGGWDPKTGEILKGVEEQIDQAFANVDITLRDAGGKGWSQVYKIRTYHVTIDDKVFSALLRNMKKWCPDHGPLWTMVGVKRLAEEAMDVEIEVEAHDPK